MVVAVGVDVAADPGAVSQLAQVSPMLSSSKNLLVAFPLFSKRRIKEAGIFDCDMLVCLSPRLGSSFGTGGVSCSFILSVLILPISR